MEMLAMCLLSLAILLRSPHAKHRVSPMGSAAPACNHVIFMVGTQLPLVFVGQHEALLVLLLQHCVHFVAAYCGMEQNVVYTA